MRSSKVTELEQRTAKLEGRLDSQLERLNAQGERLRSQDERLRRQRDRLDRQRESLDEVSGAANRAPHILEVLAAQVGAMQEQVQCLTEKVEGGRGDANDAEKAEARSLIEEIRAEHHRIRVRFDLVAQYEERLRRLESALTENLQAGGYGVEARARHSSASKA